MADARGLGNTRKTRRFRAAATVLILALASACAGPPKMLVSPYVKPEPGVFFKYGRFCGEGFPASVRAISFQDTDARIDRLLSIEPVDGIDAACRAHDICYERFGHNNAWCDEMFIASLRRVRTEPRDESPALQTQCRNLAREVRASVSVLKSPKDGPRLLAARQRLLGGVVMAGNVPKQLLLAHTAGWPVEGSCAFTDAFQKHIDAAQPDYLVAAAIFRSCRGADDESACRALQYADDARPGLALLSAG